MNDDANAGEAAREGKTPLPSDERERSGLSHDREQERAATSYQAEIGRAKDVLRAHFHALNNRDETALRDTLHFPHYRLASGRLQTWTAPDGYFHDFRARTTEDWHHSVIDSQEVIAASANKVHLDVRFTRYRGDGSPIGSYRSLWVITCLEGRWAAQLRSSFAD